MQQNEFGFHVFTLYGENDSDLDKLFERVRPEIVNAFELVNPTFTRVEVNFKRDPDEEQCQYIVDNYDDDTDSADTLIARTVRVLRSRLRYNFRNGLQPRFHYRYKDIYDRRFDKSIDPEKMYRAEYNGDWDGKEGLENTGLYGPLVEIFVEDTESEVSHITIKMLNAYKHYHKSDFYRGLRDELMAIAWHPDRVLDWCVDHEEREEMKERWGM